MEVLSKLFMSNEEFRGRVRRTHIADEIQAVSPAALLPMQGSATAPVLQRRVKLLMRASCLYICVCGLVRRPMA